MTGGSTQTYLETMFGLDPVTDAQRIVESRATFLGRTVEATTDESDRDAVRAELEELRVELADGEIPADAVARLDALSTERFPDLDRLARRFRTLIDHHPVLFRIAGEQKGGELVWYVWRVLLAPTADSIALRDAASRALQYDSKAIPGIRHAASIARRLRREAPEVYALQSEWFDFLREHKKQLKLSRAVKTSWIWFILGWILLRTLMKWWNA